MDLQGLLWALGFVVVVALAGYIGFSTGRIKGRSEFVYRLREEVTPNQDVRWDIIANLAKEMRKL